MHCFLQYFLHLIKTFVKFCKENGIKYVQGTEMPISSVQNMVKKSENKGFC